MNYKYTNYLSILYFDKTIEKLIFEIRNPNHCTLKFSDSIAYQIICLLNTVKLVTIVF